MFPYLKWLLWKPNRSMHNLQVLKYYKNTSFIAVTFLFDVSIEAIKPGDRSPKFVWEFGILLTNWTQKLDHPDFSWQFFQKL